MEVFCCKDNPYLFSQSEQNNIFLLDCFFPYLFVYSEFFLNFAAESINTWLMTTFALNNLWAYLQGLSLSQNDREWLANKLIMPKETNWVEDDNARLDEALAKFSGDFGGSADAMTVAEELRQGADMVKEVETW